MPVTFLSVIIESHLYIKNYIFLFEILLNAVFLQHAKRGIVCRIITADSVRTYSHAPLFLIEENIIVSFRSYNVFLNLCSLISHMYKHAWNWTQTIYVYHSLCILLPYKFGYLKNNLCRLLCKYKSLGKVGCL